MKDVTWAWTRVTFYSMITAYFLVYLSDVFTYLVIVFGIANFVLSIIHLTRYKEKALAIVGIILSSLFVILPFLIGIIWGMIEA